MHHAFAKINLGLYILRKRTDGFHDIATVFHTISLHDDIVLSENGHVEVSSTDPEAPGGESNICYRAAVLLREHTGAQRGVRIHITKRIPVGAGLGGGSSDAASVLRALPGFWEAPVDRTHLDALALKLGSDVPFFLHPGSAVGSGRGDLLEYFPLGVPFTILVCHPGIPVSTAWAYSKVQARPGPEGSDLRALVLEGMRDPSQLSAHLRNGFEDVVFESYPRIAETKRTMLGGGAEYASLSGSGSAVYGLFRDPGAAEHAADILRQSGCRTFLTPPYFTPA